MNSGFVRFENIQKSYDGKTLVIKSLDLSIARGEFLTLLGPSGSGKTTVLMLLAGFQDPTAGSLYLDGIKINTLPPHKRGLGMVFQNYALFPHMNVAENVAFPLKVRHYSRAEIETRVRKALDMVQMSGQETRKPAQLSGGQQQRVALARAIVFEPKLLLMDEPLGALDKQLRDDLQYEIKHLHERLGITLVYVTHDQSEALSLSDRIAVLHNGYIQQIAAPRVLYEQPENSFVASFIGENNQWLGMVKEISDGRARIEIGTFGHIDALPIHVDIGSLSRVMIRPERVELEPETCDNSVMGRVEEVIYLGDQTRIRMTVLGNDQFIVHLPYRRDALLYRQGQEIRVGWSIQDCRALKE
jgi:putative spermidine/putrescine transport system ATP-binding protein